jgi:hypothetical protein
MAHEEEVLMDTPQRTEPDGGLLKCSNCFREFDPATDDGGIDEGGYAFCAKHLYYERGYRDGRRDEARDNLIAVITAIGVGGVAGKWGTRLRGTLTPDDVRSEVERVLKGEN